MPGRKTLEEHAHLMDQMADRLGVDLDEAELAREDLLAALTLTRPRPIAATARRSAICETPE